MTTEELVQQNLIKDYTFWSLSLHTNQAYLGRAVVWCKRQDALELADATDEELFELRNILSLYRSAVQELFNASWMNFAFLGNLDRHLHGHIIPRYDGSRDFAEHTFIDPEWGKHYSPSHAMDIMEPEKVQEQIKQALISKLL